MKTAGRKPSRRLSACRSAVVRGAGKKKLKRHYEVEDDDCRVSHDSSRSTRGRSRPFPFFHAEARRRKVMSRAADPQSRACIQVLPIFFRRALSFQTRGCIIVKR